MLKNFLAALIFVGTVEAAPFHVSEKAEQEINRLIPDDQTRYHAIYDKVCAVKSTLIASELSQRDCDLLALQTALSFGKTGPEIAQQLRQSAIKQWNKQNTSPLVKQAVLKMLTFGVRPTNGYASHYFERDYLYELSFEERTKTKKEFEQAVANFWPKLTKQLKHEWFKRLPNYKSVDAAAFEAGLDHQAALDIYAALLGHQIYGWIVSGFGGEDATFNEIPMPAEFDDALPAPNRSTRKEWLKLLYTEASQLENKWHYRINDRDYHSSQPSYFTISEIQQYQGDAFKMARAFRHLPSDIRPEIVVMSAKAYTEQLPETLRQVYAFTPKADHSLLGITERLFNQNLLSDQRRFVGVWLGRQFYDQVKTVADQLGMIPVVESEEVVAFRRAQVPERSALLHVAAIRHNSELADLIAHHEGKSIANIPAEKIMAWSNSPCNIAWVLDPISTLTALTRPEKKPAASPVKAEIKTIADLSNYVGVLDNTILAKRYPRKKLADLRHQLLLISFHPKAESVNFDINPEFRSALEKLFSEQTLNELQIGLLEDHLMRLEQMSDRHIGYDGSILAHSAFYREKFMTEVYPYLAPSYISELPLGQVSLDNPYYKSYASIRRFLADGQRVFRRLQQLEIEVMQKVRESDKAPELVLQDILFEWEIDNGFDHTVAELNKGLSAEQWYDLLKKGSMFHDVTFVGQPHGIDSHRLQWNLVMREMKDHPEQYADISAGNLYRELGNAEMMKQMGYPFGDRESVWRDLFDVLHVGNFSTTDCVTRVVKDYLPGLGNMEHYK